MEKKNATEVFIMRTSPVLLVVILIHSSLEDCQLRGFTDSEFFQYFILIQGNRHSYDFKLETGTQTGADFSYDLEFKGPKNNPKMTVKFIKDSNDPKKYYTQVGQARYYSVSDIWCTADAKEESTWSKYVTLWNKEKGKGNRALVV